MSHFDIEAFGWQAFSEIINERMDLNLCFAETLGATSAVAIF